MIFKKSFAIICALSLVLVSFSPSVTQAGGPVELKSQGFSMDIPLGFSGVDYGDNSISLYSIDNENTAEIGFFDVPANWDSVQAAKHLVFLQYFNFSIASIFVSAFIEDQEEYRKFIEAIHEVDISYEDIYIQGRKFTKINSSAIFNNIDFQYDDNIEITKNEKVYYVTEDDGSALYVIAEQSSADKIISTMNWQPTQSAQPSSTQIKIENKYNLTVSYPWVKVDNNIFNIPNDDGYFFVNRENPNVFGIITLDESYTGDIDELESVDGVIDVRSSNVTKKISGSNESYAYSDITLIKKLRINSYSLLGQSDNLTFSLLMLEQSSQGQQKLVGDFEQLISALKIEPEIINSKPQVPSGYSGNFSKIPTVSNSDHIRGNYNAPVTLLVYTDFQTPFYPRLDLTLDQIIASYGDKVRIIFRHYPLLDIHPASQKAAEASECAAEQGKFWQYHDILIQSQHALSLDSLKNYAGQLGLNQSQFNNCLDSGKYTVKVGNHSSQAFFYGIKGVPATFVNGRLVEGALSYQEFKGIIDETLGITDNEFLLNFQDGDISKISPVTYQDNIIGGMNAPITLIVYSDFECPFCKRVDPTLKELLSNYDGKIRIVYRHFPLSSIHPNAQKAAEASECAAEQGKFWEMHDLLFSNQNRLDVNSLKDYASQLDVNQAQFNSCLDSGKYLSKINRQAQEAQSSGITGTPGIFVNEYLIKGAHPYSTFTGVINEILANQEVEPVNPPHVSVPNINHKVVNFINNEKSLFIRANQSLINKVQGKILLQVEENGEAWYLDPVSRQKFYLENGNMAYLALRKFGLGITNQDLRKIPIGFDERLYSGLFDSDGDGLPDKLEEAIGTDPFKADTDGDGYDDKTEVINGYNPLGQGRWEVDARIVNSLKGRIVLQVESRGEAWYINPTDGKRYFLGDGDMAYQIMRFLSLGIKNAQLREIPVGDL